MLLLISEASSSQCAVLSCLKLLNEISVVNLHDKYTLVLTFWNHLLLPQEHHIKVVWRNNKHMHIQGPWSNESVYF